MTDVTQVSKPLIFVGTHHKNGTALFANFFRAVAAQRGLVLHTGWAGELPAAVDI